MRPNLRKIGEYMEGQRERLTALFEQGVSYRQCANELGVSMSTIRKYKNKWGLESRNEPVGVTRQYVTYKGERMGIWQAAKKAGIPPDTLWYRLRRGWRGDDLFKPVRKYHQPNVYELDVPIREWRLVASLAREVGPKKAANTMRLPYGAITAAMRGEESKLG